MRDARKHNLPAWVFDVREVEDLMGHEFKLNGVQLFMDAFWAVGYIIEGVVTIDEFMVTFTDGDQESVSNGMVISGELAESAVGPIVSRWILDHGGEV